MCEKNLFSHYRELLKAGEQKTVSVESAVKAELDLSRHAINERMKRSKHELKRIVRQYLNDDPKLHEIAEQIVKQGKEALFILQNEDSNHATKAVFGALEAVVRTDGSRPSFMIRNGKVDRLTSPVGSWGTNLDGSELLLGDMIPCVGRIDHPDVDQGFAGTGFLIHENLILTNRHVLQQIADKTEKGWQLDGKAFIDFGHEFRAQETLHRRQLKMVVFWGAEVIKTSGPIDHARLDLVVIELATAKEEDVPRRVFCFDNSTDWTKSEPLIYTIGYAGQPANGIDSLSLLEQLFQTTWGCKRLAPGKVVEDKPEVNQWTLNHDATTLGGNSGSVISVIGREYAAVGLHYGGRSSDPRINWGHILGKTLSSKNAVSEITLRESLGQYGVAFCDRSITMTL